MKKVTFFHSKILRQRQKIGRSFCLKRRLVLTQEGDKPPKTPTLEPIAGPSNTSRKRICPKCEKKFHDDEIMNHGCELFRCEDQECFKLFKSKKNLHDH